MFAVATAPSADAGPTAPLWVMTPSPAAAVTNGAPLPACGQGETPTPLASQADWALTLVDTTHELPSSYAPDDLVSTTNAGLRSAYYVRVSWSPT